MGKWTVETTKLGLIKYRRVLFSVHQSGVKLLQTYVAWNDRPDYFVQIPQLSGKKANARKWARYWLARTPEETRDEAFRFLMRRIRHTEIAWPDISAADAAEDELIWYMRNAPIGQALTVSGITATDEVRAVFAERDRQVAEKGWFGPDIFDAAATATPDSTGGA